MFNCGLRGLMIGASVGGSFSRLTFILVWEDLGAPSQVKEISSTLNNCDYLFRYDAVIQSSDKVYLVMTQWKITTG